jgi:hypothetical protein
METEKRFRKVSVWIDQDLRRYVAIIPVLFFVLGTGLAGKGLAEQPFLATDSTHKDCFRGRIADGRDPVGGEALYPPEIISLTI